jgi:hypothetical protein
MFKGLLVAHGNGGVFLYLHVPFAAKEPSPQVAGWILAAKFCILLVLVLVLVLEK